MNSFLATPTIWSYGLAVCAFALLLAQLLARRQANLRGSILVAAVGLSVAWAAVIIAFELRGSIALWRVSLFLDALRVVTWIAFAALLMPRANDETASAPASKRWFSMWPAVAILPLVAITLPLARPGFHNVASYAQISIGASLAVAVLGLVMLEQLYRHASPDARWRIKPLCLGLGGAFAFDLFMYADALLLNSLDAGIWSARGIVQTAVVPFIAVSTARNEGWKLRIAVSRHVVVRTTALLGSGSYLLVVAAAGYYVRHFGGSWGKALQFTLLFGALLLLALVFSSGTARSKLRVFVSKHFFSYRYDYREEWLRFTRLLSSPDEDLGLQEVSIKALADLVESPGGALWMQSGTDGFKQVGRWNMPAVPDAEGADSALVQFLRDTGWVVDLGEYKIDPQRYAGLSLPAWLDTLRAPWLIVPLFSADELVGFVVLASPRASIELNWEVLDLLKTAGRQAGSYLRQIQASEALLEAGKFDAFNRMSAFVVHDLKNLVAQLSLLLKNAERHRDNPEFQQDMMMTVEHVVTRMNRLLVQLHSGVTPMENPRPVDLQAVVARIAAAKVSQRPALDVRCASHLYVLGHEERLERVLGHLVQNALEATGEGGKVTVQGYDDGARAVIEIIDDGVGMTPEFVRMQLFKPFQTTKAHGMGIGAYESFQYISDLRGQIEVDSARGTGTKMKVVLPLHSATVVSVFPDRQAL